MTAPVVRDAGPELAGRLEGVIGRLGYVVVPARQPAHVLAVELAHVVLGHDRPRAPGSRRSHDVEAGAVAALVLEGWRSGPPGRPPCAAPCASGAPDPGELVFDASEAILGALLGSWDHLRARIGGWR